MYIISKKTLTNNPRCEAAHSGLLKYKYVFRRPCEGTHLGNLWYMGNLSFPCVTKKAPSQHVGTLDRLYRLPLRPSERSTLGCQDPPILERLLKGDNRRGLFLAVPGPAVDFPFPQSTQAGKNLLTIDDTFVPRISIRLRGGQPPQLCPKNNVLSDKIYFFIWEAYECGKKL